MKTRTKLILVPTMLLIMLMGCTKLETQADDPNSPLSHAITAIDTTARAVKDAAPAAGPYGWIAGALATIVASATGLYKVRQKNQTIATDGKIILSQQREFNIVRDTTKAIVDAIEEVGKIKIPAGTFGQSGELGKYDVTAKDGTLADLVKGQVAEELKKRNITTMGKAIISGVKAARENDAQKMQ